ncbi:tRNA-5-carboxymethylaminomethyl-2-thiouridine(34)synthesis protein MnmE [hydrothermal vent metagenome]|uniref:tRNA-5-carboxymethylaminomethyl-2-thiouridine(34) synthesis protein MnmE n=1 Tax=hydrothermal vent metagenome TaxID=652676 RepID=A0A3B1E168_9ZZZZ
MYQGVANNKTFQNQNRMNNLSQKNNFDSPQTALWTSRGRGAVATIRYGGDCQIIDAGTLPMFHAANKLPVAQQLVGDIFFGHWGTETSEEVVLCRLSDDQLAIHCHGGEAATKRILNDLACCGVEIVSWSQFLSKCEGDFESEMQEVLSKTKTIRAASIVLQQQSGVLRSAFEKLSEVNQQEETFSKEIDLLLHWASFGLHLTTSWKVVITGRPNVGKSSLVNKLAGFERAIVFDQPGTTRDVVHVEAVFEGWAFQLIDTAGIREEAVSLEQQGIERTLETLQTADCSIILLDQSQPVTDEERSFLEQYPSAIVVANKSDLPSAWNKNDIPCEDILFLSAMTGEGVDTLSKKIVQQLVPEVPPSHTPIPVTARQISCLQRASLALENNNWEESLFEVKNLLN